MNNSLIAADRVVARVSQDEAGRRVPDGASLPPDSGWSFPENNLQLLRLVAAGLVVFGHAFTFLGDHSPGLMGLPPGTLGVFTFFSISGYLIAASWDSDPNPRRFLARRALRIFPALAVCVLATFFVLGPLFTSIGWRAYFHSPDSWGYLRNIGLYIVYSLPGVFEKNSYPLAVNGSLWTLPVEFSLYIILALVGCVARRGRATVLIACCWAAVTFFWAQRPGPMVVWYASDIRQLFVCGTYFWIGAALNRLNLQKYLSLRVAGCTVALYFLLSCFSLAVPELMWFFIPVIALSFGLSPAGLGTRKLVGNRDYSYGVYIYAFPIQQAIACLYPNISMGHYFALSSVLIMICAALSWHLVEKPSLLLKPRRKH